MNHKKITRTLLAIGVTLLLPALYCHADAPMYGQNTMPYNGNVGAQPDFNNQMFTQEDLQAMERAVEEERAKMTDEQRAQFDNDVQQLTQELEQLSPEELEAFMNQVLFEQPTTEYVPPVAPPVENENLVVAPKPEPVKPQKPRKKQDEALDRIESIIKHTNSFMHKIARYIDFVGKLKKWSDQGKIKGWKQNFTWESIKKQLEDLVHKLTIMKDKDPKTGDYKYLNDLIENEALYNNLGQLNDSLVSLEPQVEVDDFGIEPVTKESRDAIRKILGHYIEALFSLSLPADLDNIIAAYEPTAKKMRESAEADTKKALEGSKKNREYVPGKVSRKTESQASAYSPYAPPFDYNPYASPYSGGYGAGGYTPPAPPTFGAGDKSGSGSSGGGSHGGSSAGSPSKNDKNNSSGGGDTGKSPSAQIKNSKNEPGHDKASHGSHEPRTKEGDTVWLFQNALKDADDLIKENELDALDAYLIDQNTSNGKVIAEAITDTNRSIEDAQITLNKLKKLKLSTHHQKQIKDIYKQYKPRLEATNTAIEKIPAAVSAEPAAPVAAVVAPGAPADVKRAKEDEDVEAKAVDEQEVHEGVAPQAVKEEREATELKTQTPQQLGENITKLQATYDKWLKAQS